MHGDLVVDVSIHFMLYSTQTVGKILIARSILVQPFLLDKELRQKGLFKKMVFVCDAQLIVISCIVFMLIV